MLLFCETHKKYDKCDKICYNIYLRTFKGELISACIKNFKVEMKWGKDKKRRGRRRGFINKILKKKGADADST